MKNKNLLFNGAIILVAVSVAQCISPEHKIENKKEDVADANRELDQARVDYLADIESFKKENTEKIAANEKSIADFKARISLKKQEAKSDYNKKIEDLEKRNGDIQKRLEDYKESGKENWSSFKDEFNRDMIKLSEALQDFTTDKGV
ncbi:MAG: hypothetical protein RL747_378 [Bacteroidota bacterium]|jgi:chromosome segregation ATPase